VTTSPPPTAEARADARTKARADARTDAGCAAVDPLNARPDLAATRRRRQAPPSWTDATAARALGMLGGAWGRRAIAPWGSFWTPLRIVLALAAFTLLLGFAQKYPCSDGQWTGYKQYTHACYSDIVPLWSAEGLDVGQVPYRDHPVEYPVLIGGFMWVTAELTRAWHAVDPGASELQVFAFISCAGLALFAMLMVRAVAGAAGYRPYDAAIAAFSPLLVFHAFSNWDLIAMALLACAMWAWAKSKPVLSGVMIGLGTAAKLYPALMLVPLLVLAIRTRRFRGPVLAGVAAGASWLIVNAPFALLWWDNWWTFYRFSGERPAEASTIWHIAAYLNDNGLSAGAVPYVVPNTGVAIAMILAMAAVIGLGLAAPTRPRLAQLTFLAVAAFLLTTKVWSPQYSLWLVPLLALARPRWRSAIIWQCSEIAVWIVTLLFLISDRNHALEYPPLLVTLVVRDIILLTVCGLIVREMWRPELDVVRTDGSGAVLRDDPGGGIFDEARDYPLAVAAPAAPAAPPAGVAPGGSAGQTD